MVPQANVPGRNVRPSPGYLSPFLSRVVFVREAGAEGLTAQREHGGKERGGDANASQARYDADHERLHGTLLLNQRTKFPVIDMSFGPPPTPAVGECAARSAVTVV